MRLHGRFKSSTRQEGQKVISTPFIRPQASTGSMSPVRAIFDQVLGCRKEDAWRGICHRRGSKEEWAKPESFSPNFSAVGRLFHGASALAPFNVHVEGAGFVGPCVKWHDARQ